MRSRAPHVCSPHYGPTCLGALLVGGELVTIFACVATLAAVGIHAVGGAVRNIRAQVARGLFVVKEKVVLALAAKARVSGERRFAVVHFVGALRDSMRKACRLLIATAASLKL